MLWPLFYAPWAITLVSPTLGFVVSTFVVVYHYTFKAEIIQKVEMTMLPGPQRIIERYINAEPHDASQAVEKPSEGKKEVGKHDKGTAEGSHPEGEAEGGKTKKESKC